MAELINQMQEIMCTSCTECKVNWCDGEDREECKWMQKIAEVGAPIEAEIRAKTIDDFADAVCEKLYELASYTTVNGVPIDMLTLDNTLDEVKEIAEQLKEGAE